MMSNQVLDMMPYWYNRRHKELIAELQARDLGIKPAKPRRTATIHYIGAIRNELPTR